MSGRKVLIVLLALLCASAFSAQPRNQQQQQQQSGSISGEVKDEQGRGIIRYAGVVPKDAGPQKRLGLFIGLHGKGGDEKQQVGEIAKVLAACKLSREYMILGLKSKGEGWTDEDHEPIAKAIAWALKEYPVDPRRVYTLGYSSGAFGVGRFAPRHQNLVAAGIMLAGGLWDPPKAPDGGEAAVQLYLIHGEKDTTVPVKSGHEACERLKSANYRFVWHELTGADHGVGGPGSLPMKQDAIRWAHAQRNRLVPLSDDERKALDEITTKLKDGKSSLPQAACARLADLAGPEVDAALVLASQSERREARLMVATLCQQRIYGKPVFEALAALLKDKDTQVRAAAAQALGLAANWQHAEARDALCTCAKDASAANADRVNSAGQLGVCVPLQLFCVNRDAQISETFNALMEDKNPQLKQLAKLALDGKLVPAAGGFQVKQ
ncbi:MAG TPA: hypothetical protein VGP72_21355 [Planctomycetota bacterium]|jgi:predicted esterase